MTIAPCEWSLPYHAWVEDEMRKQLRSKLHLPLAETLHIAHVLAQTMQGLVSGANKKITDAKRKPWVSHFLGSKDASGQEIVVNFFARLEFQDRSGKRWVNSEEAATQFYHGRGTVHMHCLVWLDIVQTVRLQNIVSATTPEDNEPLRSGYTNPFFPFENCVFAEYI